MKGALLFIWETVKIVFIALLIVIPIRYFLFQPFIVRGASMEPNFQHNDYLIVDQLSYRFREPQRGEVVVFGHPEGFGRRYIKRIIGLPGEVIEIRDGRVIIFDQQEEKILDETDFLLNVQTPGDVRTYLAEDEFFVLGDNRAASSDSRHWGALPREDIIGRVFLRAWPFNNLTIFETPVFSK
ncbi:signal peptidase I [Dehalococcoidia bacterium]|nr:signal peptidase I [Dehalococcoidia bacterium]